jgi:serine/threonine protein kinase
MGPYEIVAPIGAGGMGEVYKREVAIKVLPASVARDTDRVERFEQEAQAAAALNHPNILVIHRFGSYEGAPYFASELLEEQLFVRSWSAGLSQWRKQSQPVGRLPVDWRRRMKKESCIEI